MSRIKYRFRFPAENKALDHVGVALKEGTDDTVFLKKAITIKGIYNTTMALLAPTKVNSWHTYYAHETSGCEEVPPPPSPNKCRVLCCGLNDQEPKENWKTFADIQSGFSTLAEDLKSQT